MSSIPPPVAAAQTKDGHYPALDGIRALAILLVIPHNVSVLSSPFPSFFYPGALLISAGWVGVQLFFVLSGFLITGALLDSRDSSNYYGTFFWRRALRILPLYYAVLIVTFVIVPLLFTPTEKFQASEHHQIWLWTFLTNWTQPYGNGVHGFAHFWSLAVEEQFYLLWPFFVRRNTSASLLRACIVITLAALGIRWAMEGLNFPHEALYMFTVCRMDALALGAAAAAAIRIPAIKTMLQRKTSEVTALSLIVLTFGALITHTYSAYDETDQTIGYLLLCVGFALMILPATVPATGFAKPLYGALSWQPLRLIGRYSYAMYIFHYPLHTYLGEPWLHRLIPKVTPLAAFGYAAVIVAVSFVLGALSYHLFEKHFLRLKSRFMPTKTAIRMA